ncbi:FAD binding domain-containing protein [Ancylobacter sp. MQZ15Z-1]|uniref:FAD binding domain-containing protein n=1 Tax=Ancylobacter mangrovi TaxID=2972472 RepID=A0A9X2PGG0_9HYPH|nr:FAD binding domain-containing protein [Ancylobacter mangrovi]MCS0496561.1 FAD binding domain-containing protein [Ancylobacter mangrovi]
MKPAPFAYHRPTTLDEAVAMLAEVAPLEGRVIAGGQSLIPMMALRLAYPTHLVDINGIGELDRVAVEGGELVVGALARHVRFETPVEPGPTGRLLARVAHNIAHFPIRSRGTMCGSLANADPASEWCLAAVTLDARLVARSRSGTREIAARDYFLGIMMTTLEPEEILVEVRLPLLPADARAGFYEFSRRAGDFALASCLCAYTLEGGLIARAWLGVGGAEAHPRRIADAEAALVGQPAGEAAFRAAAEIAAAGIDPLEDANTNAAYRRDLVRTVVRRALEAASRDAGV